MREILSVISGSKALFAVKMRRKRLDGFMMAMVFIK